MKILVIEYINSGGLVTTALPKSLADEGWNMLQTLLTELSLTGKHELSVLLDYRLLTKPLPKLLTIIPVMPEDQWLAIFEQALQHCDAVWPIAPETDNCLFDLCRQIEAAGKILLNSSSHAVAQTADKLQTFQLLSAQAICTIPSQLLTQFQVSLTHPMVIKRRDGVGCEDVFFVDSDAALTGLLLSLPATDDYIIQPYIQGHTLSLSALFKQGYATLLCINRQIVQVQKQCFQLCELEVNCPLERPIFESLLQQIARALPSLWGYVGIDLIVQQKNIYVVEINPRLTSSYTGIGRALGINVADLVLALLNDELNLDFTLNKTITLSLTTSTL